MKSQFEPIYPPEWDVEEMNEVEDEYDDIPSRLTPEPC